MRWCQCTLVHTQIHRGMEMILEIVLKWMEWHKFNKTIHLSETYRVKRQLEHRTTCIEQQETTSSRRHCGKMNLLNSLSHSHRHRQNREQVERGASNDFHLKWPPTNFVIFGVLGRQCAHGLRLSSANSSTMARCHLLYFRRLEWTTEWRWWWLCWAWNARQQCACVQLFRNRIITNGVDVSATCFCSIVL